ncbi:MAG: zinc ribbon domain-containing protein [Phycisphaerales bacterium]|nr:zinc ribbon domain-containing protein [Phycisphaerales bacterium]
MELRRLFLKIMLGSLALAAVFGILGVLVAASDALWRVMTTAFVTAGAAALMIPMSMMVDRQRARGAGLLGMGLVVVEFVVGLALTWSLERALPFVDDEQLALSMVFVAITGIPAMFFLWMARTKIASIAGWVGAILSAVVLVLLLAAIWLPRSVRMPWDDDLFATSGAVASLGPLMVASLVGIGGGDRRWWQWLGVIAATVSAVMVIVAIWQDIREGSGMFVTITSAAVVLAHANLVVRCPLSAGQRWLRWSTIGAASAAGLLVSVVALEFLGPANRQEFMGRLIAAFAIAAGCGSLALLVLARLNRRVDFEPSLEPIVAMTIVCPRCHKKQSIAVGDARCDNCALRIHTRIEDPRCPSCGYALYRLESDRCPECGTVVRGAASDGPPA